ncbi:aminoglycoside phosphotransferase family protein [Candidatus Nomurabacteria bacterium]|nr:aminoglycoside phosphotransferase family protein [Candidatus Nomurabacteria bacterium]
MEKRKLLSKIRKEFPDLKWKRAEHNVEGWDHYVIILDDKYVFRFPRAPKYLAVLKNEILLLEYLKDKVGVPVPQYTYVAEDKSFAGYSLIPGIQLKKKVFDSLPKEIKKLLAKQIADFLSSLHKISYEDAKKCHVTIFNTRKHYNELVLNTKKYIFPRVSKKDQLLIDDYLKEFKKYLKFPKKVLTHNDLYSKHILLSKNKKYISGIIDFSDRRIDDPARDFAEIWDYGEEFILEVYKNYKGHKDKDFLKRAMLYYKRIPLWTMISPFQGGRGKFKKGYKMFKELFYEGSK